MGRLQAVREGALTLSQEVSAFGRARLAGVRSGAARLQEEIQARPALARALAIAASLVTLGITAWVFWVFDRRFYYWTTGYDEEFFVWGGWSIRKGLAPYRDFIEFKPPMVFITHAIAQMLFGYRHQGYRAFFTIFPLLSLLALQTSLLARGVGRLLALAVMLGFIILFVTPTYHDVSLSDAEGIGVSYYLLGLALLLWEGRYIKVTTVLGGFFMACCVLSKEPFVFVVVFSWLGLFWLRGRPGPSRESATLYARYSLLGVGLLIFLLCVYMVPTGAMRAYLKMAAGYATIYSDPKRSYCVALGAPHADTRWGAWMLAWPKTRASFFNETRLGYLAPLTLAGAIFSLRRSKILFAVLVCVSIGALWAPTATLCQWVHYYNMTMAGLLFVIVVGVDSLTAPLAKAERVVRWGVGLAALAMVCMHGFDEFAALREAHYTTGPWPEPIPGVVAFIARHTTPTDRIFTTGPPGLYPETNRISAVRESNIIDEILGSYDGDTDEERLRPIYQQLVKNKPKVVVLDPENAQRKGRTYRALVMPFLTEFHYQKVSEGIYLRP